MILDWTLCLHGSNENIQCCLGQEHAGPRSWHNLIIPYLGQLLIYFSSWENVQEEVPLIWMNCFFYAQGIFSHKIFQISLATKTDRYGLMNFLAPIFFSKEKVVFVWLVGWLVYLVWFGLVWFLTAHCSGCWCCVGTEVWEAESTCWHLLFVGLTGTGDERTQAHDGHGC